MLPFLHQTVILDNNVFLLTETPEKEIKYRLGMIGNSTISIYEFARNWHLQNTAQVCLALARDVCSHRIVYIYIYDSSIVVGWVQICRPNNDINKPYEDSRPHGISK